MTRKIEIGPLLGREPRDGELNHEFKRILQKYCNGKKPFKQAIKSVQLAVARLAKRYGFKEFQCEYEQSTSLFGSKPWVNEQIQILVWRKRSNRTLSVYRAGASSYPHFFEIKGKSYGNLSVPRDITIYYGVDEPYTWREHCQADKIPARMKPKMAALQAKLDARKNAHS